MKLRLGNPRRVHMSVDLLSAYLDNQVTAAERARIEEHLPGCPACRSELDGLRQTVMLLRAMPSVSLPRAFTLSEAQVGIRRPASRSAWYGGALRGLAAVTAVALVAVVATTLLRHPTWTPSETVARVAPAAPAPAVQPPAAAPTAAVAALAVEKAAPEMTVAVEAVTNAAAPAAPQDTLPAAPPAEAPALREVAPAATPTTAPEAEVLAKAAQPAPEAPAPAADVTAVAMAMAAPQGAPGAAAAASGRGGGLGGGEAAAPPAEALTPQPIPPLRAISDVFPAGAGMAYADRQSLWAIDRESGTRGLVESPGVTAPLISPDREWVAYRIETADSTEIWAVRWEGGDARLLLADGELPKDDLGESYSGRRILGMRWVPGRSALAVTTTAIPALAEATPKIELWNLDVQSGALQYILDMGQVDRPLYAPEGTKFVLLSYGTASSPVGSLSLHSADGTETQELLTFPAGPNVPGFESQVGWLPDSSGLWVAIPDPILDFSGPPSGVTLYRVPVKGRAEAVAHLDGLETFWSPDGTRLAHIRTSPDRHELRELLLANADGSDLQSYTTFRDGAFGGWSPDSKHFNYYADYYVYAGTPGQAPEALGNSVSVIDPRWVANGQMLHFLDTGAGWMLVLRTLGGDVAGLVPLPSDISYDVHGS